MFTKILTATDMLGACDSAVITALGLAKINGGRLFILHVLEPSYFHECGSGDTVKDFKTGQETVASHDYREAVKSELDRKCAGALAEYGNYQIDIAYGRPSVEIRRWARKHNADAIVLGPHAGREDEEKELIGTPIGNTVEDVIMNTARPVMIVNRLTPAERLQFGRVTACIDFSPSSKQAFLFSLQLVSKLRSKLFLLHVSASPAGMERRLAEFCPIPSGVEHEYKVLEGTQPHSGILNFAEMNSSDLLVMGSHSKERGEKAYVGSAVEQVSVESSCPVCVVTHPEAVKKMA